MSNPSPTACLRSNCPNGDGLTIADGRASDKVRYQKENSVKAVPLRGSDVN
ncbi:hypothetical protein [Thalassoporum mexicanum]|uniref:hypothetical protein n=1 Tax=Thalassoporum mexicanum TaxID=3457544 RepID=UPI0002F34E70|nr:hypothetical protein [Pseudanabaena sp. PCC 7367]